MRPPGVLEHTSNGPLARPPLTVLDASALNLKQVTGNGGDIPIAFRADTRSYEDLVKQKGFLTRARSPTSPVYASNALDQPWHPYNSRENANCLFLRMGETNKDNCLHTVISVGKKFAAITHFPILNDGTVFEEKDEFGWALASKPIDSWTNTDIQNALDSRHKIRTVNNGQGPDLLEKDVFIYVLNVKGLKGVNTEAQFPGDDKFPERGMEKVPLENIMAEIRFTQKYFYKEEDGKIVLYELDFGPIRWTPSESAIDTLLGVNGKQRVVDIVNKEITKAKTREDVTFEASRLKRQNEDRAANRLLTKDERDKALAKLREIGPGDAPISLVKKNAVMNALPALKPKLRFANWAWMRDRAMRPGPTPL